MKKILLFQSIFFMGNIVAPLSEIEVPDQDAESLISSGAAKACDEEVIEENEVDEATRLAGQVPDQDAESLEQDPFESSDQENDEVVSLSDIVPEEIQEKPKTGKKK